MMMPRPLGDQEAVRAGWDVGAMSWIGLLLRSRSLLLVSFFCPIAEAVGIAAARDATKSPAVTYSIERRIS